MVYGPEVLANEALVVMVVVPVVIVPVPVFHCPLLRGGSRAQPRRPQPVLESLSRPFRPSKLALSCRIGGDFCRTLGLHPSSMLGGGLNIDPRPHDSVSDPTHLSTLDVVRLYFPILVDWIRFRRLEPSADHAPWNRILFQPEDGHGKVVHHIARLKMEYVGLVDLHVEFIGRRNVIFGVELPIWAGVHEGPRPLLGHDPDFRVGVFRNILLDVVPDLNREIDDEDVADKYERVRNTHPLFLVVLLARDVLRPLRPERKRR